MSVPNSNFILQIIILLFIQLFHRLTILIQYSFLILFCKVYIQLIASTLINFPQSPMQKLKHLFYLPQIHSPNPKHQIQHQPSLPSKQLQNKPSKSLLSSSPASRPCKDCMEKTFLINKYDELIKLLKIKIIKLEKQLQTLTASKQNYCINQFQNFKMQLDSDYLQTGKNVPDKPSIPFKQIQLCSIIGPKNNHTIFNQTQKTSLNAKTIKPQKTSSHFSSKNTFTQKQTDNQAQATSKTQKVLEKPLNEKGINIGLDLGKQISFSNLIHKSFVSLQSAKDLLRKSNSNEQCFSSIKVLSFASLNQASDQVQEWLKKLSPRSQDKKVEETKRVQMLEKRIILLSENIFELKTFLLHVRHSVYQFIKMTDTKKFKSNDTQGRYMLGVIIKMFEYSEQEMEEMFPKDKKKNFETNFTKIFLAKIAR